MLFNFAHSYWILVTHYALLPKEECVDERRLMGGTTCSTSLSLPMLLLTGPSWPQFDLIKPVNPSAESTLAGRFVISNHAIYVDQEEEEDHHRSDTTHLPHEIKTAYTVWDCSIVLAKFLEHQQLLSRPDSVAVRGRTVVELGAGRGIVGMAAARLGARATLTDVEDVCPMLRRVVEINGLGGGVAVGGDVEAVVGLDWTEREMVKRVRDERGPWDYVLAADVVWVESLIEPLVLTMAGES
ncbi:putative methyltransferase-domain-containing protein [Blyttiomyces helicus]|uniref:Putative methyltransferase-domain-containing protein n=1 Tax=Blyttiomyces helicus TaxID=388810 RepID=A0A4P9WKX6_9FUNG|nr:putative methyltransferase-domain-containing protein [Blyttiomyces helicus]|eukprot:RKO93484.1 putative methyltransferase-domain-containing protein [Blyttiomyces helicus]